MKKDINKSLSCHYFTMYGFLSHLPMNRKYKYHQLELPILHSDACVHFLPLLGLLPVVRLLPAMSSYTERLGIQVGSEFRDLALTLLTPFHTLGLGLGQSIKMNHRYNSSIFLFSHTISRLCCSQ